MIYLLTAIGLSAGGSSTVHIYTLTEMGGKCSTNGGEGRRIQGFGGEI